MAETKKAHLAFLDTSLVAAEPENFKVPELAMPRGWGTMKWPKEGEWEERVHTGVSAEVLKEVGRRSVQTPDDIVRASFAFSLGEGS